MARQVYKSGLTRTEDPGLWPVLTNQMFFGTYHNELDLNEELFFLSIAENSGGKIFIYDELFATGEFEYVVYDNPTVTANGTQIPLVSRNFIVGGTSSLSFYLSPTVTANGTQQYKYRSGSGKKEGGTSRSESLLVAPGQKTLIYIKSYAGTNFITYNLNAFEHNGD